MNPNMLGARGLPTFTQLYPQHQAPELAHPGRLHTPLHTAGSEMLGTLRNSLTRRGVEAWIGAAAAIGNLGIGIAASESAVAASAPEAAVRMLDGQSDQGVSIETITVGSATAVVSVETAVSDNIKIDMQGKVIGNPIHPGAKPKSKKFNGNNCKPASSMSDIKKWGKKAKNGDCVTTTQTITVTESCMINGVKKWCKGTRSEGTTYEMLKGKAHNVGKYHNGVEQKPGCYNTLGGVRKEKQHTKAVSAVFRDELEWAGDVTLTKSIKQNASVDCGNGNNASAYLDISTSASAEARGKSYVEARGNGSAKLSEKVRAQLDAKLAVSGILGVACSSGTKTIIITPTPSPSQSETIPPSQEPSKPPQPTGPTGEPCDDPAIC